MTSVRTVHRCAAERRIPCSCATVCPYLSAEEWVVISSQFVMTSKNKRPKSALPLAFTEHGVVMLSSVLRSDIAVQTSV
ncbi:MAG: ORF6N domain-containing protein, partial [Odoribacter splanchnicus]